MPDDVYLGELEQTLLWTVLRLGDGAYGTTIREELSKRTGREVTPGALYTTLDRLEAKGMIRSRAADPEPSRGGRPKRYVEVTPDGHAQLARTRVTWERLWDGLGDAAAEGS